MKDWKLYLTRSCPFRAYKWDGKSDGVVLSVEDARETGFFIGDNPEVTSALLSEENPNGHGLLRDRSVGWFIVPPGSYIYKDESNHYAFEQGMFFESKYYPLEQGIQMSTKKLEKKLEKLTNLVVSQQHTINKLEAFTQTMADQTLERADGASPIIYRYVRLTDPQSFDCPDNLNCITFAFRIDYAQQKLFVGWAIAKGENVRKAEGRKISSNRLAASGLVFSITDDQFASTRLVDFVAESLGFKGVYSQKNLFNFFVKKLPLQK